MSVAYCCCYLCVVVHWVLFGVHRCLLLLVVCGWLLRFVVYCYCCLLMSLFVVSRCGCPLLCVVCCVLHVVVVRWFACFWVLCVACWRLLWPLLVHVFANGC